MKVELDLILGGQQQ
uniref:Uncharacterized protein n=1 Tax=Rhizophora mucronata TaxID=61149 RepID=A0A2P2R4S0_RHIMU